MTEAILRLALTTDGGKWAPGTILGAYPLDERFGPADMAGFKLVRVKTDKSLDELKAMRCKKVIALSQVAKSEELSDLIVQKQNVQAARIGGDIIVDVGSVTIKPSFSIDAEKDMSKLVIADAPPEYMPKDELPKELPMEEEKVR